MRNTFLILLSSLLMLGVVISLFLPYYETITDGLQRDSFKIMSQYMNPDQSGMFGGGFYTTYNGFGSLTALSNSVICLGLELLIFSSHSKKLFWRILLICFILSQGLLFLELASAPFLLSSADTMLIGYYIMTLSEICLFIISINLIKKRKQKSIQDQNVYR